MDEPALTLKNSELKPQVQVLHPSSTPARACVRPLRRMHRHRHSTIARVHIMRPIELSKPHTQNERNVSFSRLLSGGMGRNDSPIHHHDSSRLLRPEAGASTKPPPPPPPQSRTPQLQSQKASSQPSTTQPKAIPHHSSETRSHSRFRSHSFHCLRSGCPHSRRRSLEARKRTRRKALGTRLACC
jgi:hypothetical protein